MTISNLMKMAKIPQMCRKHCGKREIARDEQFLLFPQCFEKTSIADTLKPGLVWERVKGAGAVSFKRSQA